MLPLSSPEPEEDCLITKIESCSRVFAFVDGATGESGEERDVKTEALVEVLAAVRASEKKQGPGAARVHHTAGNRAYRRVRFLQAEFPPNIKQDDEIIHLGRRDRSRMMKLFT
uniref:Uncharacterized protein n=1 Tax=Oryza meridionalis TaxID=40149 RepID=A0A0E0E2X9_9ORYZ